MKNKLQKGEIATIIALGSMAFILLTTLATTFISKKSQTTSTKAAGTCGSITCAPKNSNCQLGSGGKCYSIGSSCRNNSYCANEETNVSCCGGGGGASPAKSPIPNKTTNPTAAKPTSGGGGCPPASGATYDLAGWQKCICTNCQKKSNGCYADNNTTYPMTNCCPRPNGQFSSACNDYISKNPTKAPTTILPQSCSGSFSCVSSTTYCSASNRGTSAQDASCNSNHTGDKCCKNATPTKIPTSKPTLAQTTPQKPPITSEPNLTLEQPTSSIPGPTKTACPSPGICRYDLGLFGRQCDSGEENIGQKCYDNFGKYGWQWGNCCAKKLEPSTLPILSTTPATIGCEGPYKCLMVCNSQGIRYSKKADENVYVDNKGRVYDSQNCRSYTECGCTDKLNEAQSVVGFTFTSTSQQVKADGGEMGYIISMPGGGPNFVSGVSKF